MSRANGHCDLDPSRVSQGSADRHSGPSVTRQNRLRSRASVNSFGPVVVGLGEVLWDRFPDGDRLGGAPANFRLSCRSARCPRQARLARGPRFRRRPPARGPGRGERGPQVHPEGRAAPDRPGQGEVYRGTADLRHRPARRLGFHELDRRRWPRSPRPWRSLAFGTLAQRNEKSRTTIQRFIHAIPLDAFRLFDINLRQKFYNRSVIEFGLDNSTLLKLNGDELAVLAEMFHWGGAHEEPVVELLLKNHALKGIVVTHGEKGCNLYYEGTMIHSAAPQTEVRDTVGAGRRLLRRARHGLGAGRAAPGRRRPRQRNRRLCRQPSRRHAAAAGGAVQIIQ